VRTDVSLRRSTWRSRSLALVTLPSFIGHGYAQTMAHLALLGDLANGTRTKVWSMRANSEKKQIADRDNNFNLLRILAAGAVLISHAYPLSLGPGAAEPLERVLGISLGTLAVLTFFAISGYFISQSFHDRRSFTDFAVARVLRIYPGLITVLVLTVLAVGPLFTNATLAVYFTQPETWLYIPKNLRLWNLQYALPAVFEDNPYPGAINGSLWTLVYEVACYAMVAVLGIFGMAANRRYFSSFLVVYAVCYLTVPSLLAGDSGHLAALRNLHLLALPFIIGMSLFQFRESVPIRFPILITLAAVSAVSYGRPGFHELFVLAWSYGVFCLGFLRFQPLLVYNRLGDYSYGTYIYAFPIEQIVVALYRGCTPLVMVTLSVPLTLLFAVLSWHCIERRALAKRSIVSSWLGGRSK
jgi:peptidoglycan/LPS O-acetylase OafA/YrhL